MRTVTGALVLLLTGLGGQAAQATPLLSGSFDSVAASGYFETSHGEVNVAGTDVTGGFELDSLAGAYTGAGLPAGEYILPAGDVQLGFDIKALGSTVVFGGPNFGASAVELLDNGTRQAMFLVPSFSDPHVATELALIGPEGSLFDSVGDLASLHVGPGVSLASPIFLSVFQVGGAKLDVTDETIRFTPVPEPGARSLLATALLGLCALRLAARRSDEATAG